MDNAKIYLDSFFEETEKDDTFECDILEDDDGFFDLSDSKLYGTFEIEKIISKLKSAATVNIIAGRSIFLEPLPCFVPSPRTNKQRRPKPQFTKIHAIIANTNNGSPHA